VEISLGSAQRRTRIAERAVRELAATLIEAEGSAADEVGVVFIEDEYSRELNRRYRGKDTPTDVLAFPLSGDPETGPEDRHLGEVYINVDRAAAQAAEHGATLSEEIARLLVHGLLHLLGYDHEASAAEKRRMREREEKHLRVHSRLAGALVARAGRRRR
jgi:rRNA maturation RNase YbeY